MHRTPGSCRAEPPDVNAAVLARRGAGEPGKEPKDPLLVRHRPNDYRLNSPGVELAQDLHAQVVGERGSVQVLLDDSHQAAGGRRRTVEGGAGDKRIALR